MSFFDGMSPRAVELYHASKPVMGSQGDTDATHGLIRANAILRARIEELEAEASNTGTEPESRA